MFHYLLPVIDLVIGMPIYASCIMESCAGEKPVICFDETHWPHLMLAELPKSCLVSTDKALFKAVEQLLDNSSALNSINKKIDPYLDQRGHERFGYYLELWVRHIRECGSADKALPKVKTDYYKKWPLPNKANRVQRKEKRYVALFFTKPCQFFVQVISCPVSSPVCR